MGGPPFDYCDAIAVHSAAIVEAAAGHLGRPVRGCPGWDVADLVWHLTEVHWFWATIVEERLTAPPGEARRPARAGDASGLLEGGVDAARRLVRVLRDTDPSAAVWTWAPTRQDVAFVARHQVQEAAVHHWDVVDAGGGTLALGPGLAADAVAEFLTFSVSSADDPADPPRPSLGGTFVLEATDARRRWVVRDGPQPGTVAFDETGPVGPADPGGAPPGVGAGPGQAAVTPGAATPAAPTLVASASDLLLWLYGRRARPPGAVSDDLLSRFRGLCFTQ